MLPDAVEQAQQPGRASSSAGSLQPNLSPDHTCQAHSHLAVTQVGSSPRAAQTHLCPHGPLIRQEEAAAHTRHQCGVEHG